jgi:mono/diheme cytochrome c family protein
MRRILVIVPLLSLAMMLSAVLTSCVKKPPEVAPVSEADMVSRGQYLVHVAGCNDCHTPGYFYGAPDTMRLLSGSEMGWKGPWGVSYARNLTPEPQTGLGAWSEADIVTAIRTGKRPDGAMLLPPMPWPDFAHLTDDDAIAIAKYLKTLTPVMHKVPDKLPPDARAKGSIIVLPAPSAWDAPRSPGASMDTTGAPPAGTGARSGSPPASTSGY